MFYPTLPPSALSRLVVDLERSTLLAEKNRREVYSECTKELRSAERDALRRDKKLRERQAELADVKAAITQANRLSGGFGNGNGNGNGSDSVGVNTTGDSVTSSSQQAQFREEKLCLLVEKLLADLERSNSDVERKNGVIKTIADQIAAASAAANTTEA